MSETRNLPNTSMDLVDFRFRCFKLWGYEPSLAQERIHRSYARRRMVAAAARSGKSYLASREAICRLHYPLSQRVWIVAPTYNLAEKVFREVYDFLMDPNNKYPVKKYSWRELRIELITGHVIEGKSADRPDGLLGEKVDFMIVDEASRIEMLIFTQYLLPRLMTTKGDLLGISTPHGKGNGFHKLYLKGDDPEEDDWESFHMTIYDNPLIDVEEVEKHRRSLEETDPDGFKQEFLGEFVDPSGDVFPSYSESAFIKDVRVIDTVPVSATLDPGTRAPCACLFIQKKGMQVRVIDEYYKSGLSSLDNAMYLKPIFEKYEVTRCIVDAREPDAIKIFQRVIPTCTFIASLADKNNVNIKLGYDIIRDHLKYDNLLKDYLLVIDRRCRSLKFEFNAIKYPKGENEIPIDRHNHAISALRYYLVKYCNFLNRISPGSISAIGDRMIDKFLKDHDDSTRPSNLRVKSETEIDRLWMGGLHNEKF